MKTRPILFFHGPDEDAQKNAEMNRRLNEQASHGIDQVAARIARPVLEPFLALPNWAMGLGLAAVVVAVSFSIARR